MRKREEWEKIEDEILAPYSVKSSQTLGRKYPEKEHDFRSPFQRDRDRIIHSTAFRRLEYKTQVFIYHEGDYYRNRLTHTIEVQQIARTIARILRLNEDLVEAIALAHDIGHTPFGHKGEVALNELMKDFGGFEHNRHGLRVVDWLEKRYPDFPGLNLTFEVREGIIRHKTIYDTPLEGEEFEEFKKFTSPSLETQVVNFADEIAFTSHDLDDGLKSGIISEEELHDLEIWKEVVSEIRKDLPADIRRVQAIRNLINILVLDLVRESEKNIKEKNISSIEDVRKSPPLLRYSEAIYKKHTELRKFLEEKMYSHYRVIRMAEKAYRIIRDLFFAYKKEPRQLPPHIQKNLKNEIPERVICDYIAGMTDRFALEEHRKLFDATSLV
ncbi:MAG: deoxyguanosinetriphosphate triphosphohydrolase [Candidatus Omnitrophota bacterium]|nr:MAG: deoxyguanosinetriphosphate triphosphohydrolase [Candidatus Omnitrophota bacterium]